MSAERSSCLSIIRQLVRRLFYACVVTNKIAEKTSENTQNKVIGFTKVFRNYKALMTAGT